MTNVVNSGLEARHQHHMPAVNAVLQLQRSAGDIWTWRAIADILGLGQEEDRGPRIWYRWQALAHDCLHTTTPVVTRWNVQVATAVAPALRRGPTPIFPHTFVLPRAQARASALYAVTPSYATPVSGRTHLGA